jgi:uncharacterized metal-binding protein YceD (DUF177 family)
MPEFSRIVKLDEIARIDWPAHIEADPRERDRLTQRFGFLSLDRLEADYSLTRDGKAVNATGTVHAELAQPCIASGAAVPETVREDFKIRFVPDEEGIFVAVEEETELDAQECDVLPFSGNRIDIGEAVAETLALAINPYPRSPDADAYLREAGVIAEDQAGPFAALAVLKGKLEK